jgi:CubicO group peptidase (beta-lactamase class C family)
MRQLTTLLLFLLSACATASHEIVRNESAKTIDATLQRMVRFGLSGTVLVADADGILLSKGYGLADVKGGVPNRPDTIFDMGSITKTFTATAIALLEAEGKLSADDLLSKHFANVPGDKASITLRQVLSHTAGLVDLTGDDFDDVSRDELIEDAFRAPLVSAPGAEYHYSNAGYSLLAAIVEKTSGQSYHAFLRERLFAPAAMRDTGYTVRAGEEARVAHTYTTPVDHGTPWERLVRTGGVHWVLLGNGGMLTTTEDLFLWETALRRGTIVPPAVQKRMLTPIFERPKFGITAAYAWSLESVKGENVVHHGSDDPTLGVNGEYRRYPDQNVVIIFLGNTRLNGWSPRRIVGPAVRRMMRGETLKAPAVLPTDTRTLADYAGTYLLTDGSTIDLVVEGDHLVAGANGQSAIDLFTVQRSEQSLAARRDLNEKAVQVVRSFDWSTVSDRYGKFVDATILGTSRRDRGVFMTTVRATFDRGPRVLRFAWSSGNPIKESDDERLPGAGFFSESPIHHALERPLWRTADGTFVFYDIYADETIAVKFEGDKLTIGATEASRSRQ